MNLIELSEHLTLENVMELLARRLLMDEQEFCMNMCEDADLDEKSKRPYRNTLANSDAFAQETTSTCAMLIADGSMLQMVERAVRAHAEEYTRIV